LRLARRGVQAKANGREVQLNRTRAIEQAIRSKFISENQNSCYLHPFVNFNRARKAGDGENSKERIFNLESP
jgi:hypothetical protein